jgi:hypothetical protein
MAKVLHLTLKKKWFDMIASGEKKEEYREIKPFWATRLLYKIELPRSIGFMWAWKDIQQGDFSCSKWKDATGGAPIFNEDFHAVKFVNGGNFHASLPMVMMALQGMEIREGKPEWGAEPGKKYFVIKLGERIA